MVTYIEQDHTEFFEQQRYVLDVFEMSRDRHTVQLIDRNDPQQRHETVADDMRLHDVRVAVESTIYPATRIPSRRAELCVEVRP